MTSPQEPAAWLARRGVRAAAAAGAAAAALLLALCLAHVTTPPGTFGKYPLAARAADPGRAADYSPLYLAIHRSLAPIGGTAAVLWLQTAMFASACSLIALAVAVLAGPRWGAVAGLAAATYRPFLVYCAVLEPEILIVFLLAAAIATGTWARSAAARRTPTAGVVWAAGAGLALGLATLARPQYLLLAPVWAVWVAARRDVASGARSGRRRAAAMLGAAAVVVAPVLASRWLTSGEVVLMNPGPVFFEGNGSGTMEGLARQPDLVKALEAAAPGTADWAHVAYREIAAASSGRAVDATSANRYWASLALAAMRAAPAETARRFARKTALALGPYELHDLPEAFELDRRLRRVLPWGFGLLLLAGPLLLACPRSLAAELAGPLAVVVLSLTVQVVFYPSARQRLPAAIGMIAVVVVALAHATHARRWRLPAALGAGAALAAAVTFQAAPAVSLRESEASTLLGAGATSVGERLAELADGRAWRPRIAAAATDIALAPQLLAAGANEQAAAELAPIAAGAGGEPRWLRARAAYWMARSLLASERATDAERVLRAAVRDAPGLLPVQALLRVVAEASTAAALPPWPPVGVDPLCAAFVLAREQGCARGPAAALAAATPVLQVFPSLGGAPACTGARGAS